MLVIFQELLSSSDGQMTMALDLYKLIQLPWTWLGANPHSGCWDHAFAIFQALFSRRCMGMSILPRRTNGQNVEPLQSQTVPINSTGSELAQWLLNSGVYKIPGALIIPITRPPGPVGQMTMVLPIYRPIRLQWTLMWGASTQCFLGSGVRNSSCACIRTPYHAHGQTP